MNYQGCPSDPLQVCCFCVGIRSGLGGNLVAVAALVIADRASCRAYPVAVAEKRCIAGPVQIHLVIAAVSALDVQIERSTTPNPPSLPADGSGRAWLLLALVGPLPFVGPHAPPIPPPCLPRPSLTEHLNALK